MRSEIRRIHDETGLTTVYVTHDQSEALVLADRIVVMADGDIQQAGTPEEIYERPETKFVAQFIGRCNVLPGILLSNDDVDVKGVVLQATDRVEGTMVGEPIALSIRPHAIAINAVEDVVYHNHTNSFHASIEQHAYFGEFREYRVRLEHSELRLTVVAPPHVQFQTGDRVVIQIPPHHCRILPSHPPKVQPIKNEEVLISK
jgi:iron(III) transport system ATP-binding protein